MLKTGKAPMQRLIKVSQSCEGEFCFPDALFSLMFSRYDRNSRGRGGVHPAKICFALR